jgi:hypothetical protein
VTVPTTVEALVRSVGLALTEERPTGSIVRVADLVTPPAVAEMTAVRLMVVVLVVIVTDADDLPSLMVTEPAERSA